MHDGVDDRHDGRLKRPIAAVSRPLRIPPPVASGLRAGADVTGHPRLGCPEFVISSHTQCSLPSQQDGECTSRLGSVRQRGRGCNNGFHEKLRASFAHMRNCACCSTLMMAHAFMAAGLGNGGPDKAVKCRVPARFAGATSDPAL